MSKAKSRRKKVIRYRRPTARQRKLYEKRQAKLDAMPHTVEVFYEGFSPDYDALIRRVATQAGGVDIGSGFFFAARLRDHEFRFADKDKAMGVAIHLRHTPGVKRVRYSFEVPLPPPPERPKRRHRRRRPRRRGAKK